ncbi:glycosyltransferase [Candidatus Omnitrophota bacterium]
MKKKILLLGEAPLPIENSKILTGPGIRTWQFAEPLLRYKHKLCLVCFSTPGTYNKRSLLRKKTNENFIYNVVDQNKIKDLKYFQRIHDSFRPDCILSMSSYCPLCITTLLKTTKPIWFDQGDLMAEAQIKSSVDNCDECLYNFLRLEKRILSRGDIFSTVSMPQKFALIGKLGEMGRLNKHTVGYDFVYVIPCGTERVRHVYKQPIIRGKYVEKDDFVILWSGGYNNWADIDTLYLALEKVMANSTKIKFVSSSGSIDGQSETLYTRFLELISKSRFKDRYIMLSWLSTEDLPNLYLEANLGINIDKYCYEVLLGSRHRLLDWMRVGLPVLTTKTSELTQILIEKEIVFTFPINDAASLSSTILSLLSKSDMLKDYSQRAKKFVYENFLNEKTIKPFLEWLDNIKHSPDIAIKIEKGYFDFDQRNFGEIEQEYIKYLKDQIDSLRIKGEENKKLYNQFKDKEIELTNLKHHASNLEGEIEGLKKQTESLNLHSTDLQKQIQTLINERDSLKLGAKDKEIELTNLKHHASNLEREREELRKHAKNLEGEIEGLKKQTESLNLHSTDLQKQIQTLINERDSLKLGAKDKEIELTNLKHHASNLEGEIEGLKKQTESFNLSTANLQNHLQMIYSSRCYKIYRVFKKLLFWRKKNVED